MNMHPKRQQGLTLIEIMIALTISLLLLAGVIQIFISNKQTYRMQEASARLQESGRFAIHFLTQDFRMAGFFGCGSTIMEISNIADVDGDGNPDEAGNVNTGGLEGFEYSDLPIVLSDTQSLTSDDVVQDTDIIRIKRGSDSGVRLTGNMTADNANIQLDADTASGLFEADDILFITDCGGTGDVFAANNVSSSGVITTIAHSNSVNIDNKLSKAYDEDAEVMHMVYTVYYIGTNSAGEPSLYRRSMGNAGVLTAQELVEGVEDMQLLYGEDTDDDETADIYVDADSVSDMTNVVSIRVSLTVRSVEDNITSVVTSSGDKRLRRTFSTTTTLRNRVS
jgi:type IV pilus assembly protein PilW